MSLRTSVKACTTRACDACPWRVSNRGRRTSGGWYTLKNIRRLWAGLRSGDAPGMTCHPTDPDNPPADDGSQAKPGVDTNECYGALLLVAREFKLANDLCEAHQERAFAEYRKRRPKGLTRNGLAHWVSRFVFGSMPLIGGGAVPQTWVEDEDIQHPDFDPPEEA